MEENDYSEYVDETPLPEDDDRLTTLRKLGAELVKREAAVVAAEAALQVAKLNLADLAEKSIPALMKELQLSSLGLTDGQTIEVEEMVAANISEERRDAAHDWLEKHEQGGLIKRNVVVSFSREQEKQAAHLVRNLSKYKTPMPFTVLRKVEPSTLKKAVREMLEAGDLDEQGLALLGVFKKPVACISKPKEKKAKGAKKSATPF